MEDGSVRGFKAAAASVQKHLGAAIAAIDLAFGDGYAKANPSLVAAYVQACALEDISVCLAEVGVLVGNGLVSR